MAFPEQDQPGERWSRGARNKRSEEGSETSSEFGMDCICGVVKHSGSDWGTMFVESGLHP